MISAKRDYKVNVFCVAFQQLAVELNLYVFAVLLCELNKCINALCVLLMVLQP